MSCSDGIDIVPLKPLLTQNLLILSASSDSHKTYIFASSTCSIVNVENDKQHQLIRHQHVTLHTVISSLQLIEWEDLWTSSLTTYVIDAGGNKQIKQRRFSISPAIEKLLYPQIDWMRSANWVFNLVGANSVTAKDAYPLPLSEGIFSYLLKATFY